jgi:iron(III) transport system ATP-binding protein
VSDLELEGVSKSFGERTVLHGVDLAVVQGSFTAILGPSGSGKTTLLRVVAGLDRADGGRVVLGGEVVDDGARFVPPERRRIGYVPQEGGLFPHLTVQENVGFGLPRRERHGRSVRELIEMAGLGGLERRYPHQLSGGQQQRVALARALAIEPVLVLLDEPFASLDAALRASLRQEVRDVLRSAGATALLVTHDQDEALSLADEVALIADGRVAQHGPPQQLYARPVTPELASSLGGANFLAGRLCGRCAETALGRLPLAPGAGPSASSAPHRLRVLVRPEQLVLSDVPCEGSDDDGRHVATARVLDAEFYGHDALVRLRPGWDASAVLVARVSDAAKLPAAGRLMRLAVRGEVVAWPEQS